MDQEFPIGSLIARRQRELGISKGELVRRIGFKNAGKESRRLEALRQGDLTNKFVLDALPAALDVPADEVNVAIRATADQLAEEQRLRLEEEEARYRKRFTPHVLWVTERDRPSSITMVAFVGVERLLRFDLDLDRGEETFVSQAIAGMPSSVGFFGRTTGFYINLSPDKCVQYDREGDVVARFTKARRPGWADVTLKGDSRSILPLYGVKAADRYER
jgi:hypothetical protein